MKRRLLVLAVLAGCAKATGGDVPIVAAAPAAPSTLRWAEAVFLPGDTFAVTLTWPVPVVGPGAGAASGYIITLTASATNGTWFLAADSGSWGKTAFPNSPLPFTGSLTPPAIRLWYTAATWDSVTLTASVAATNPWGTSAPSVSSHRFLRKHSPPGPPGPPVWDTTTTVLGMLVKPDTTALLLARSRVACGFFQFPSGGVAEATRDRSWCDSIWTRTVPAALRTAVTAAEQAIADTACVAWTTSNPAAIGLAPRAPCAGAVTVTGLGLTLWMRVPMDVWRYVGLPVAVVGPNGRVSCLRPGRAWVYALPFNHSDGRVTLQWNLREQSAAVPPETPVSVIRCYPPVPAEPLALAAVRAQVAHPGR